MKQQVNLYLREFRQQKDWLDFNRMLGVAGLGAALLLLAAGLRYSQVAGQAGKLAERQEALTLAASQTTSLMQRLGEQTEDLDLAENVRRLEEELQGKRVLLDFLEGRSLGNADGFSHYLADLSRYLVEGVRLTGIELSQGGGSVELSGEVVNAANVTLYLQNLGNSSAFAGKSFEALRIREAAAGASGPLHNFDVSTGASRAPGAP